MERALLSSLGEWGRGLDLRCSGVITYWLGCQGAMSLDVCCEVLVLVKINCKHSANIRHKIYVISANG